MDDQNPEKIENYHVSRVNKLIQAGIRFTRILCLAWILMPGSAIAWHTLTHPYLARIAFYQMPIDFQDRFQEHFTRIVAGSVAPDLSLRDWSNHEWNVHSEEGFQAGAPARVEALFVSILEGLAAETPDDPAIADELGLLSHYLADINQPLHTDEMDLEGVFHAAYEWEVYLHQNDFSFLDHGRTFVLDPYSETISMAVSANRYFDQILEGYAGITGCDELERTTALCLQSAVDAITDAWTTLWKRACPSGPHIGIRTNQAFFVSNETVEILLSTMAGNTPAFSADIYVAVVDHRGVFWFIDSEGMCARTVVPYRSNKPFSDEKTVVLSLALGEISQASCYRLYAAAVPEGRDPFEPQRWLTELAGAWVCLSPDR